MAIFLPFELFQQRYGINCNFLSYFQVISAIRAPYFNYPRSWPSTSWNLDLKTIIGFFLINGSPRPLVQWNGIATLLRRPCHGTRSLIEWRLFAKRINLENFTLSLSIALSLRRKNVLSMELQATICLSTVVSLTQFFIHFKTVGQQLLFAIGCWTGSMRRITPLSPRQTRNYYLVCRVGRIIPILGNRISVYYFLTIIYIITR